MALAKLRGTRKSFCPSEAARALDPVGWRALMGDVRRVASGLPLLATQKGVPVDLMTVRGPVRLALLPKPQETD